MEEKIFSVKMVFKFEIMENSISILFMIKLKLKMEFINNKMAREKIIISIKFKIKVWLKKNFSLGKMEVT